MVQARRREGELEDDPAELVVHLVPMRRRHLRSVLRIEAQVYPRPWSLSLFMSELALRSSRAYYVARIDRTEAFYRDIIGLDVRRMGDDGSGHDWLMASLPDKVDLIFFQKDSRPGDSPMQGS